MVFHNVFLRIWIIRCFIEQAESHILHLQSARKASSISLIWGQYEKLHSCKMTCVFNLPVVSYSSCRHCPHSVCKPLSPLSACLSFFPSCQSQIPQWHLLLRQPNPSEELCLSTIHVITFQLLRNINGAQHGDWNLHPPSPLPHPELNQALTSSLKPLNCK